MMLQSILSYAFYLLLQMNNFEVEYLIKFLPFKLIFKENATCFQLLFVAYTVPLISRNSH